MPSISQLLREVNEQLNPLLDARFQRLIELFPDVLGFFADEPLGLLQSLPNFVPNSRRIRDATLGVVVGGVVLRVLMGEWQTRPDRHMDERASAYIAERVHRMRSRSRVDLWVIHPFEVLDRSTVPFTWPWRSDDVVYRWHNIYLPDFDARDFLREDIPALAALSPCANGGTSPKVMSQALDLLLTLDLLPDDRASIFALHRVLAELNSVPNHDWNAIMNEKSPETTEEVEDAGLIAHFTKLMDFKMRERYPETYERLDYAEARLAETEKRIAALDARLTDRDAMLADREAQLAEKEAQLAEREAQLADKDAILADKDAILADKDAKLADKDAKLADKDAILADKDAKLAKLADLTARLEARAPDDPALAALRTELNTLIED